MGKSLIRLITNTTPFSRAEVDILSYIYKILNGELPQSGLSSLIKSNDSPLRSKEILPCDSSC